MAAMGDDVRAGTVSRRGHGLRQPHDRREPCLFHLHRPTHTIITNKTTPHFAEALREAHGQLIKQPGNPVPLITSR